MIEPYKIEDSKLRRLAVVFALFVFVFEIYVVGVNYSSYFVYLLEFETAFFSLVALACILISFYLFFWFIFIALSAKWPYRTIALLVFGLGLFVEYAYQKALGRFSDRVDIESAIGTTGEQQMASLLMYFNLKALVPFALLLMLMMVVRAGKPRGMKDFVLAIGFLMAAFAMFPYVVSLKFPTFATGAFIRTATDFAIYGPISNGKWATDVTGISVRRRLVNKPDLQADYRPPNNIVVVVDESVTGDHLSLNGYDRETTPFLDKLESDKILHNWGIATAASTGSRFTYNALITGLTPDDFPDRSEFKLNTFPTIFQYAKAMNYRSLYFDGQMHRYWSGTADDNNYFDKWEGVLDVNDGLGFETWDLDNMIAKKVKKIISSSTGNFIFIFKHGDHIPYQSNFPPDQAKWRPSYETANKFDIPSAEQLPAVKNAYDNSIRYNLDSFFKNLIDDYSKIPNNTVIIYTGDHGQTLFANGRSSHGGNTKVEATVPLFIIGNLSSQPDTAYRASHSNIFPTVLDLMQYPPALRDVQRAPSLFDAKAADSRARFFNPDLGIKVAFD